MALPVDSNVAKEMELSPRLRDTLVGEDKETVLVNIEDFSK